MGDWNQYTAIDDRWWGKLMKHTAEKSDLLHTLAGGNVVGLTENKRSVQKLFDFCKYKLES